MLLRSTLLSLCCSVLALHGPAWAEPADAPDTAAEVHVLDNGLTVVLDPHGRTDTAALAIHYGVGSRDERDGEKGCAHLFEHLMFEGSANVGNNAFDRWLEDAGGSNNAYTSEDETVYYETFPTGALDLVLFLESDRMAFLDAGLSQANLDNQQAVVLQEREQGYADPNGRDWDALSRLQWPESHPYHVPVIGTVDDIRGFSLEAVQTFWQRHYRPRNATLVLSGPFDRDHALQRIQHWFSDVVDTGEPPERSAAWEGTYEARRGVLEDAVEERSVYLSWATVPAGHPDAPALELLSWVLEGGRGTRLDDRLYYGSDLATAVTAYSAVGEVDGHFVIAASSPSTPLGRFDRLVRAELRKLARSGPTEAELDRARTALRNQALDSLETPLGRALTFVDCYALHGDPNCLETEAARYDAVTPSDVVRVIETWLVPDRAVALSVVPQGDRKALKGSNPVALP